MLGQEPPEEQGDPGQEVEIGMQLVSDSGELDSWERYCRLILCSNEFLYVE